MNNWNGKPYHSLDYMLRERFGEKVYKVTLNGGMSCPNRDGIIGHGGCIFCSEGGSGDFAASAALSITRQIDSQIEMLSAKRPIHKYIAYFQAYTNTYAPVPYLERIFTEAISHPGIVALSIGTRPDCLGEDVIELLSRLNKRKPVWVELGLQTIHESTAAYIRRIQSVHPPAEKNVPAVPKAFAAACSANRVGPSASKRLPVEGSSVTSNMGSFPNGARQPARPLCPGIWRLTCSVCRCRINAS